MKKDEKKELKDLLTDANQEFDHTTDGLVQGEKDALNTLHNTISNLIKHIK